MSRKKSEVRRHEYASFSFVARRFSTSQRTAPKVFGKIVKIRENVTVTEDASVGYGFHEHVKTP